MKFFAQKIAPALGVTIRFVGEEPLCNITRQYNEALRRILPQHGIKLTVIPRKEYNGEPISASHVRKLIEQGDFDLISQVVPNVTFRYLLDRKL